MPEQIALDIAAEETGTKSSEPVDLAISVLKAHDGDAIAAIRELLADTDFLKDQLYTASCIMSHGMARDWKPQYERLS